MNNDSAIVIWTNTQKYTAYLGVLDQQTLAGKLVRIDSFRRFLTESSFHKKWCGKVLGIFCKKCWLVIKIMTSSVPHISALPVLVPGRTMNLIEHEQWKITKTKRTQTFHNRQSRQSLGSVIGRSKDKRMRFPCTHCHYCNKYQGYRTIQPFWFILTTILFQTLNICNLRDP